METELIVNPEDVSLLISKDIIFRRIIDEYGLPPNWQREPGFRSLSKIILGQQLSLESAEAHFRKLNEYIGEFTPENILKLSDDEMKNCFISRQKATYLRELSMKVLNNELVFEELTSLSENQMIEKLTAIKGIGNWTAGVFMLFCMQAKDIFPVGDIALVNAVKELYNVATKDEVLRISESWKPRRSLASYFLWHYYLSKRGRIAGF